MPPRVYGIVNLTPDGETLAVHVGDVSDYIWIHSLKRGEGRKLAATENTGWPIWSPDGTKLGLSAWKSSTFGQSKVVVRTVDQTNAIEEIAQSVSETVVAPSSWSPDGRTVALDFWGRGFGKGFFTFGGRATREESGENRWGSDFSPDGRWVAYSSDETGQFEVVVRSFPDGKIVRQISSDGGIEPRWCRCGELFYRRGNRWMSVKIKTQPDLQWDPPQLAFETDFIDTPGRSYDVSPDGKRLLVVKRAQPDVTNRINLITNWTQALERSAPTK